MIKRRKKIRTRSFLISLLAALFVWGTVSSVKAHRYKTEIDAANEKALTSLCEYMDTVEVALTKSLYAAESSSLSLLTSELQRASAGAKESLSVMNAGETSLYNTYKFLSQVGEFTASLNKKTANGEEITAEERETLKSLLGFAAGLSLKFEQMASLLSADYFSFDKISSSLTSIDKGSEKTVSYLDSISDAELSFEDYPTLIYDGPFSDNILNKPSELLENAREITKENAKKIAAKVLGLEENLLVEENDTEGKTAAYNFRTDTYSISITKKGGFPLEIMSNITAGEEKITHADATEKAVNFLNSLGYYDMISTYSSTDDGICTINFAYKQGSFICYSDLIKVSVSLTDGQITAFEATDYVMHHEEREIPDFVITPEEAIEKTSSLLQVKKVSAAVIPDKSGNEKFTYELLCEDTSGQHVLVYKDIVTGEEADILILLYSDNGTLTK